MVLLVGAAVLAPQISPLDPLKQQLMARLKPPQGYSGKYLLLRNVAFEPGVDIGGPLPDRFDIIFPRSKALVRHCVASVK